MSRLTKLVDGSWIENHDNDQRRGWKNGNNACMTKLAEYENIIDDPAALSADLAELAHYRELKAAGRLVELPCKVGDTIYKTSYDCTKGIRYNPYNENGCSTVEICLKCDVYPCDLHKAVIPVIVGSEDWIWKNKHAFGKTVFLTHEAAKQALEEK
ncbi:MAG: hypothetical protein RSD74_02065 [Angelakisella sp.]